jgi:hypothetical protein
MTGDQNDNFESAPPVIRTLLQAITKDPAAFRRRTFETMPRVFFALLPVFAGITALFFRRRPFPTHLTFAAHLHAFVFVLGAVSEGAKLSRSIVFAGSVASLVSLAVAVYVLRSFKAVYRESWGRTLIKVAGIAVLYAVSAVPAFIVILAWAALGS